MQESVECQRILISARILSTEVGSISPKFAEVEVPLGSCVLIAATTSGSRDVNNRARRLMSLDELPLQVQNVSLQTSNKTQSIFMNPSGLFDCRFCVTPDERALYRASSFKSCKLQLGRGLSDL